jgi:uncharacterized protein with GYD domain
MAHYLVQVSYTSDAWAALIRNPQNRIEALTPMITKLGGRFESAYFTFGEYDLIAVLEMPANVDAAAFSLAASAGGAVKAIRTTPLMTTAEGVDAMRKAALSGYAPPAGIGAV